MNGQLTDRYLVAKRIALAAMELDGSPREELVAREVGGDAELAREVQWMIAAIERSRTATLPIAVGESIDLSGLDAEAATPRRYHVVRRLGEGGMGMVYLAERSDGDIVQQVALKFLHAAAEGSPILLERFTQERKLLARLEHPCIARLLDGGVLADGKPFLALEYVDGERIDAWCDRHGLGLAERIALFLRVCAAVEYAHRNLVIHRDIKPANILVTADGTPKLLDFGIARLIGGHDDVAATATGHHALTLAYASPEQIEQQPLTTAVDVYGLGMVLYQLVAGRRPWQHITAPHRLSQAIVMGEIVPPSRSARPAGMDGRDEPLRRAVPADVDAIALKALRRQASERYASVSAFADDLRNWLERRPVRARRGRGLYRLRRFLQRNRWPLAAAAALLLSVLAGLAASLYSLRQARAQQHLAERREHQLERMVQFQQSMYESVDIDAMGHAMATAVQRQVRAALAEAPGAAPEVAKGAGKSPPAQVSNAALERAFARVQATDLARSTFDAYVVSHTLDSLDRSFPDALLLAADLRQSLARVLLGIGSYAHAADELRKVSSLRDRLLPASDRGRVSVRVDLAQALEKQGQTAEATAVYEQAGRLAQAYPLVDSLRIAAEAGAARMLVAQGHRQQALEAQQRLIAQLQPLLPSADPGLMQLKRDSVDTLVQMGRTRQAQALLEPLVALEQRVLGKDNPETLRAMLTLAKLFRATGEFERSLALAKQVATSRESSLGSTHPATEDARYVVDTAAMRLADDLPSLARVQADVEGIVDSRRARYGSDNPQTLSAMTGLVTILSKEGDVAPTDREARSYYARAIAVEQTVLESHVRLLGADHPHTLLARGSLAGLLDAAGQYREALKQAKLTLEGQHRALAPDDPIILGTLHLIGDIESDLGDWDGARTEYQKALTTRAQKYGPLAPITVDTATRLYEALIKLRERDAASAVRKTYLDPLVNMDPAGMNASMHSVRKEVLRALGDPDGSRM
ncbi:serine/threonine protein kinase [Frateuria sp. Soil773]|uniref:serine/threonine-protein kinase n=1 Tax=Frateuria sp. Soil773 TaxID=1736407 RepID=UPI0006F81172|nr:serine/threonine-protein kinase [Frateuria sp. Soil773]KRE88813.1 serine/threonine protein kinase [Frateuria sp. Soil773]